MSQGHCNMVYTIDWMSLVAFISDLESEEEVVYLHEGVNQKHYHLRAYTQNEIKVEYLLCILNLK